MNLARCFCVSFLWLLAATFAAAQVNFKATTYPSGDISSSNIAFGDFNNDGLMDMVSVNATTLSFYRGIGNGNFAAPVNSSLPDYMGQVLAADFNRDGKLDLVIAPSASQQYSNVLVLLGNGDGTFKQGSANLAGMGTPVYMALADFNGDHIPDIVLSSCYKFTCGASVLLGKGDGTFTGSATLPYGGAQVVTGDFNADGFQDIAVIEYMQFTVYLGDGKGNFQSPLQATMNPLQGVVVGDFYNDRIQSLAVLTGVSNGSQPEDYYVSTVRYVNGTLAVSSPQLVNVNNTDHLFFSGFAAGDVNGDFLDDVVLAGAILGSTSGVADNVYMLGKGDGTFESQVALPAYGTNDISPIIRDINMDSRHDIGMAWSSSQKGGAYVLVNSNAPTNCTAPPPNKLAARICAPKAGQVVGQTFTFKGSGNAFNGIAKRMELWIDNVKVGQNLSDQLNVTTSLSKGAHKATVVVVDSFDESKSVSVNFTSSY